MATRGVNKVTILGRLGEDPEPRLTKSEIPVLNLSVATTEIWKDKDGGEHEETEWHRLVFFRNLAKVAAEYCRKGDQIYVDGKLQTRSWEDQKTGEKRYLTEIVVGNLQLLGKARSDNDSDFSVPPR